MRHPSGADRPDLRAPSHGGAWTDEKRHGIGFRLFHGLDGPVWHGPGRAFLARRGAADMRSRAYAADAPFAIMAGDPGWEDAA